ncbi:MAG TPA: hypothetical protein VIW29_20375 [Polyangiaceae bacterium]
MRPGSGFAGVLSLWLLGCKQAQPDLEQQPLPAPVLAPGAARPSPSALEPRRVAPISSAAQATAREVQARKLQLAPVRLRQARLAFGDGVVGQLTATELVVRGGPEFEVVLRRSLEGPRALVSLADGSLLAAGARGLLVFAPSNKQVRTLARPVLLPGSSLLADAIRSDRVWVFDEGGGSATPASLSSLELDPSVQGILLPSQRLELEAAGSDVLGTTREGVWIHWSDRKAERFGPGGARLPALRLPDMPRLIWALPARRLDQCFLVDESGRLSRAIVSPSFRQLAGIQLSGQPLAADVGDEGRLVAVVVVAGAGPRFELQLFDSELSQLARVPLPAEAPTGLEDWVRVVTENQGVSVAARQPRVAVGGPARLLIFDALGKQVFSSISR